MKKALIIVLFILSINRGFSQLTVTPEIGYNKTLFNTDAPGTQIVTTPLSGFQVGGIVTKYWAKHFFLQSGLEFAQKGSYQGRGYQALYGTDRTIKLSYLQVPLNVGFDIPLYKGLSFIAAGGVYGALGISGTDKGSSVSISGSSTIDRNVTFKSDPASDNTKSFIKPLDAGFNVLAGLTWQNIIFKTTYSKSFKTIDPISTTSYKNEIWNFSVGYTFKIK